MVFYQLSRTCSALISKYSYGKLQSGCRLPVCGLSRLHVKLATLYVHANYKMQLSWRDLLSLETFELRLDNVMLLQPKQHNTGTVKW